MKKNRKRWYPEEGIPGKFLRKMKLILFLCWAGMMQVSAMSYAQTGTVSIRVKETALHEIFQLIEAQCGYTFVYNNEQLNGLKPVSIEMTDAKISKVLDECLKGTDLRYELLDQIIVINRRSALPQTALDLQGTVKDKEGNPLPGVSVFIKGTTIGVVTDVDGKFKMQLPEMENMVLVFSFTGMKKQEVKYTKQPVLNIVMEEDVAEMEEVVVNGYFTKNKDSFTGNAVVVSKDELAKVSSNNLLSALQVFDPSFRLKDNVDMGSNPNSMPNFRIRGNSGFGAEGLSEANLKNDPNLPTFILDGYEVDVEKIFDLNMDRIESVTILKDASATAIYGSRAANGVVVVTTKAPQEGQLRVSYNLNVALNAPDLSDYHLLNAKEKLEAEVAGGLYESEYMDLQQLLRMDYADRLKRVKSGVDTYWLSQPLEVAVGHKHSLYVEGGDKSIRYGIDLNYQANPGVMKKSSRDRFGVGFLLSYNLNNKLLFRNKLTVDKVKSKESPYGTFRDYALANPYERVHDDDGNLIESYDTHVATTARYLNPLYEATLNHKDESVYSSWTDNFDFDWFINDHFRLKARVTYSERTDKQEQFTDPRSAQYNTYDYNTGDGVLKKGEAYSMWQKSSDLEMNAVFSYNQAFGNHFVNAVLGANMQESRYENESYSVIGFPAGNMDYISFGNAYKDEVPSGEEGMSRLAGAFLNVNYTYNNIYMLDFSGRLDGSSKFGNDKKYAPFGSLGIGWNIHNESFWEGCKGVMSRFKISANIGSLGKASFEPYEAQDVYNYYKGQWYAGGLGAIMSTMGNTNLQWEKTRTLDVNLETGFLNDLITLNASYYLKRTKDLVSSITLPLSSGFESYRDNLGELENKGFEISARAYVLRKKDAVVNVFGSIAHNKNVIKKISNSLESYNKKVDDEQDNYEQGWGEDLETAKPLVQFKEGQSTTAIYAVKSLGINPMNGRELFYDLDGNLTYDWSASNKIVCGDTEPKVSGSFGANADWKGFNLNVSFLYQLGGQVYNQTLVDRVEDADLSRNVDERVLKGRWQKPGDHTFFKDIASRDRTEVTSRFVQDENVLTFKSLSLSYSFPQKWIKKMYMERLKLTFQMEDLFRISTVKRERGLDYPFARAFNFGLQVQF